MARAPPPFTPRHAHCPTAARAAATRMRGRGGACRGGHPRAPGTCAGGCRQPPGPQSGLERRARTPRGRRRSGVGGCWSCRREGRAAGLSQAAPVGAAASRQGRALGSPRLHSRQAPLGQAAAWTPPRFVAAGDAASRRAGETGSRAVAAGADGSGGG